MDTTRNIHLTFKWVFASVYKFMTTARQHTIAFQIVGPTVMGAIHIQIAIFILTFASINTFIFKKQYDCQVTLWSEWSTPFGFGQISRDRQILRHPSGGGQPCPILEEVKYTGKTPSVRDTANKVKSYFIKPGDLTGFVRDIVLIMDSSGSIGLTNFSVATAQLSSLLGLLCPVDHPFDKKDGKPFQHQQAAMLTFSKKVFENFNFNDYSSTTDIQKAISAAPYYGRTTNTAEAFRRAVDMFQGVRGARTDKGHVKWEVLILTDGNSDNGIKAIAAAKDLQLIADVYGLMTGRFSTRGMDELTAYVSSPINEHLFYVENLRDLGTLVEYIEAEKKTAGVKWCPPLDLN